MRKIPLLWIREQYSLKLRAIAEAAQLDYQFVWHAQVGRPIQRSDADKILCAISELTGNDYTLENVDIELEQEHNECGQADEQI